MTELENQRLAERFYENVYESELNSAWKLIIHCRLTSRGASLKEAHKEDA
jgi:hypothetical protein